MGTARSETETVIRNHLQAFVEQRGIAAILDDYHDDARFHSEDKVYRGKAEIRGFFEGFIGALPEGAIERFALKVLRIDGDLGYITWCVGNDIPLGTDTFVVRGGKIVSQTFAMHAAATK